VPSPIAEDLTGLERIVDSTPQLKIGLSRQTAQCKWDNMMELQSTGLCTAALTADEGAASLISGPDGSTDMSWHMPLSFTSAIAADGRRRPRPGDRADFRALCLPQ
jgi:hypothetical protein